jgi:hypothetical protein
MNYGILNKNNSVLSGAVSLIFITEEPIAI